MPNMKKTFSQLILVTFRFLTDYLTVFATKLYGVKEMKRFLIKREMSGAGNIPKNDLNGAGQNSEEILKEMRAEGKNIQQEQSYVVGEAIFCVYNPDSEDLIKEHSERSGAPADEISEVKSVIRHNTSFVS